MPAYQILNSSFTIIMHALSSKIGWHNYFMMGICSVVTNEKRYVAHTDQRFEDYMFVFIFSATIHVTQKC